MCTVNHPDLLTDIIYITRNLYDTKQVTNIYFRNADNKEQPIFRINYNPDFDFPVVTLITFPFSSK
jgi:hypothetical protein